MFTGDSRFVHMNLYVGKENCKAAGDVFISKSNTGYDYFVLPS